MSKHLSLPERIIIEKMIHQDYSFATIGRHLNRSASTIAREVLNYRCFVSRLPLPGENDCVKYSSCLINTACEDGSSHRCSGYRCKRCYMGKHCMDFCPSYVSSQCPELDKPPYVCSNCPSQSKCAKNKAYYSAHKADISHHKTVRDAHKGIRRTPDQLREIEAIITPLIAKGQSLNHICTTHADQLVVSERTLYNYIDKNVFRVRNIDLPKKVAYRKRRSKKALTRFEYQYRQGRTYEDFLSYTEAYPDLPVVEMDTVKGNREKGKIFLTMIFRRSSFMLIFLMKDATQESVIHVFDALTEMLGMALFKRLFPIILTDNGVEFKDPQSLEFNPAGLPRTRVFFCDPQASWQKPQIENSHRLIRRILPKGTSFNSLTVQDTSLIVCHVNSVMREQLGDKTPFAMMTSRDEKKLLSVLNLSPIPPDEVILKPELIKH